MTHAFDKLKTCLGGVKKWLSANKLKLNPDKTLQERKNHVQIYNVKNYIMGITDKSVLYQIGP